MIIRNINFNSALIEISEDGLSFVDSGLVSDVEINEIRTIKKIKADNSAFEKVEETLTAEFNSLDFNITKLDIISARRPVFVRFTNIKDNKRKILTIYSARLVEKNTSKKRIKLEGYCDTTRKIGDQLYEIIEEY